MTLWLTCTDSALDVCILVFEVLARQLFSLEMILLHHLVFTAIIIGNDVRIFGCPLVRVATAGVIALVVALIIWMRFP